MKINLTRNDSGVGISPAPPYILKYLQYTKRGFVSRNYKMENSFEKMLLYTGDNNGGVYTLSGFYSSLTWLIEKNMDTYITIDNRSKMPDIDWNTVKDIGLRDYQVDPMIEFLQKAQFENGIALATGGFGKGHVIAATYAAWHNLNTIITAPAKAIAFQLYELLREKFPNKHVGMVGGGMREIGSDVTVATFKSLEGCALEKCEMLLVDELQGSSGDGFQNVLVKIKPVKLLGYTATNKGLFNGGDKLLEGIYGETLIEIGYEEATEVGAVVPIRVFFVKMPTTLETINGDMGKKIKRGIMNNDTRNRLLGDICKSVPNKWQTLIFVDQIKQHLIKLFPYMPEGTEYVHRNASAKKINDFAMSTKEQDKTIQDYIHNKTQYLIATDALKAGVNLVNTRVLVQASGGSSRTEILQEAFRCSRVLPKELQETLGVDEKTHSVIIDIYDNHDEALENMSKKRYEYYASQGWDVSIVDNIEQINWN